MSTENQTQPLLSDFNKPSYEAWRAEAEAQLKGVPFEKRLVTRTYEGINLQPLYWQADVANVPNLDSLPGYPPYLRHSKALGHVDKTWDICQELSYSTAEEFNQALQHDLARGQTAINMRLDKATLLGQDPDEAAADAVGAGGMSIATVEDLEKALAGVDLEATPLFVQASSAAMPITALLMALVRRQNKNSRALQGGIEMDPLGNLIQTGSYPRSIAGGYDIMARLISWAKVNAPQFYTVTVHGQPYNHSGGNAVQELAFVISTGVEYLRAMQERGLTIDDVAPRFRFAFSVGSNYFMEVAKLRAARVLWAKVVKAFGGNAESQKMTMHVRTSAWNKTAYDPYVNMLRTTTEAFAGAAGGCDSMHVSCFDEAIRLPDEFSRRIARNTHLILQAEAHLNKVVDPAGGSWYVEKLTDEMGRMAWQLFQDVEKMGGMFKAMQAGFPQTQVAQTAKQRANGLATRKDVFVGTNKYPNLTEKPLAVPTVDYQALHKKRAKYVADYRTALDDTQATTVMAKLSQILEADAAGTLDAAIEAALAGATLGELARTLRTGDETPDTVEPVVIHRGTEMFEGLRLAAEAYQAKTGHRPQIFLATMGPLVQHKGRADFSTDFFQVGGFEMINQGGFATPEAAAEAAVASGAAVAVICSTDATYPELVPPFTQAVKAAKPDMTVILAGYAADQVEAHKAAGVDDFIHLKSNAYETLANLQRTIGIMD